MFKCVSCGHPFDPEAEYGRCPRCQRRHGKIEVEGKLEWLAVEAVEAIAVATLDKMAASFDANGSPIEKPQDDGGTSEGVTGSSSSDAGGATTE